jgi:hypothetical protein
MPEMSEGSSRSSCPLRLRGGFGLGLLEAAGFRRASLDIEFVALGDGPGFGDFGRRLR